MLSGCDHLKLAHDAPDVGVPMGRIGGESPRRTGAGSHRANARYCRLCPALRSLVRHTSGESVGLQVAHAVSANTKITHRIIFILRH